MGTTVPKLTFADCTTCSGRGTTQDQNCVSPVKVKAGSSSFNLPRAVRGTGKPDPSWTSALCVVCLGTGWIWTEFHLAERHSHASNLLSKAFRFPRLKRLGHADTNVTARVYAHALPADDDRAADVWDLIVDGPVQ